MDLTRRECLSVMEDAAGRLSALVVSSDEGGESYRTDVLEYDRFEATPATVFSDDFRASAMWKAPSGRHFLCDVLGVALWQEAAGFQRAKLEAEQLYGLWGLAEDAVYAVGEAGRCFRFDGTAWRAMHLLGGPALSAIHGRSRDELVVAGDGLVARWDGTNWRALDVPARARFRAIHLSADGTVYAAGLSGAFVRWAGGRMTVLAGTSHDLHAVQVFQGVVYVGSADGGIHLVEEDRLVSTKPKARGYAMHASSQRLSTCGLAQMAQFDGAKWKARSFT